MTLLAWVFDTHKDNIGSCEIYVQFALGPMGGCWNLTLECNTFWNNNK